MDKYIKMLVIKLSEKYKVSIAHIMTYNEEKARLSNSYRLTITPKGVKKPVAAISVYTKRDVVMELSKWVK